MVVCTFKHTYLPRKELLHIETYKSYLNCPAIFHSTIYKTDTTLKATHKHLAEQVKIEIFKKSVASVLELIRVRCGFSY